MIEQQYTVMVPHQVQRTGTRTVMQPTPGSGAAPQVGKGGAVQAPGKGAVQARSSARSGAVVLYHAKPVTQEYTWTETIQRPETRTRQQRIVEWFQEPRTREIPFVVNVPQQRTQDG